VPHLCDIMCVKHKYTHKMSIETMNSQEAPFAQQCEAFVLAMFLDPTRMIGRTEQSKTEIAQNEIREEVRKYTSPEEKSVVFQKGLNNWIRDFQKNAASQWRQKFQQEGELEKNGIDLKLLQKWQKYAETNQSNLAQQELAKNVFATLSLVSQMLMSITSFDGEDARKKQLNFGYTSLNETVPIAPFKDSIPGKIANTNIKVTLEAILLANVMVMDGVISYQNDREHFKNPALRTYNDEAFYTFQKTSGYLSPSVQITQQLDTASMNGWHGANSGAAHIHLQIVDLLHSISKLDKDTGRITSEARSLNFHQYFSDGWSELGRELELHTAEPAIKKVSHFTKEFALEFAL